MEKIYTSIKDNKTKLNNKFKDCSDFLLRECYIGKTKSIVCVLDGMINSLMLSQMIMNPILNFQKEFDDSNKLFEEIKTNVVNSLEMSEKYFFEDLYFYLSSGFAILLIDGVDKALVLGIQGFEKRITSDPPNEPNIKGAKECFTETLNDNKAIVRRRLKTPDFKLKQLLIGENSKTSVVIAYLKGSANEELVKDVENRILNAPIKQLLDYGQLLPFLDSDIKSFFSGVGTTERPDTFCSKILEGRIGILIDGSPTAMYVPNLFTDSFSTVDDYDEHPFYATLNRILKYFSFVISIILPGFYVATGTFHQELIPTSLMFTIASAEAKTPFSLMEEALLVLILYEIMREAGLRLPKAIGHAVSIIGALVIGDAIVNAGLVGAPMLVVVAVTAISSYVIYPLYESISALRLIFIVIGRLTGIFGLVLGSAVLCVNITSINPYGVPYSSPISPLSKNSVGDTFYRQSWKKLSKKQTKVQDLRGANIDEI